MTAEAAAVVEAPTLERHLDAIDRHHDVVNAVVTRCDPATWCEPTGGPLDGVGFTVKDTIETAGVLTTAGTRRFAAHVPTAQAPAVQVLLDGGARLLGKTNVPPYAAGFETRNPLFGVTRNPWDPGRSPGGSSGGGAAAVAAGMTAFDLGSDAAGSLIVPAHFCGVTSHRATPGLIDNRGHIPPGPGASGAHELPVFGILAPTPIEVARVIDVFAPVPHGVGRSHPWKVAVWSDDPACHPDETVAETLRVAAAALRSSGAEVSAFSAPVGLAECCGVAAFAAGRAAGAYLPAIARAQYRAAATPDAAGASNHGAYARGVTSDHAAVVRHEARRCELTERLLPALGAFDAVICPAAPHRAPLLSGSRRPTADTHLLYWPSPAVALGLPSTTTPVAVIDGLPSGVQVLGAPGHDTTTLAIAALIHAASFALLGASPTFSGAADAAR